MAPENKTTRQLGGRKLAPAKKLRQPTTTRAGRLASGPGALPAPDSLALANIDTNAVAVRARASAPPGAKPIFKVTLLGPANDNSETPFGNPAVLDLLDLVRQRHGVDIETGSPFLNSLNISGSSSGIVRAAHDDVNGFMHKLRSSDKYELFMVQPTDDKHKQIALSKDLIRPGLARHFFHSEPGGTGSKNRDEKWLAQHTSAFRIQFALLASVLTSVPANLHMEVQFGRVLLHVPEKQNPDTSEGPAARLNQAVAQSSANGSIVFDRSIGGADMFKEMQQQVFRSRDEFYPSSSVLENLLDVESQRFLVGVTESFRFQLEIGPPGSAPDKRSASLSHLRVFQTLGSEGNAGLSTACPNHNIDWKLETVAELVPDEIPATVKSFLDGITVVYSQEKDVFPTPIMRAGLCKEHRVKELYGKTAWTVGCKGSRYMLELSLCDKLLSPHLADEKDRAQMGVTILNSAWEEALKTPAVKGGSRNLGANWDRLFSPSNASRDTHGDGIDVFLKLVGRVLSLWDKALVEACRLKASRRATESQLPATPPPRPILSQQSGPVDLLSGGNVAYGHNTNIPFVVSDGQVEEDLITFD